MSIDVALGECRHAIWFEELEPSAQSQAIDMFTKTMHDAVDCIAGRLVLPRIIEVRFSSVSNVGRGAYACAIQGEVWFSQKTYDNLLGEGDALLGLCAHELSHVSDYETSNDCSEDGWKEFLVSEGKAENVAIEIAGDDYLEQLCLTPPDDEEIEKAFLHGGDDFFRYLCKMPGGMKYAVSAGFVDRVKRYFDSSIFDIHRHDTDFFIRAFEGVTSVSKTR